MNPQYQTFANEILKSIITTENNYPGCLVKHFIERDKITHTIKRIVVIASSNKTTTMTGGGPVFILGHSIFHNQENDSIPKAKKNEIIYNLIETAVKRMFFSGWPIWIKGDLATVDLFEDAVEAPENRKIEGLESKKLNLKISLVSLFFTFRNMIRCAGSLQREHPLFTHYKGPFAKIYGMGEIKPESMREYLVIKTFDFVIDK